MKQTFINLVVVVVVDKMEDYGYNESKDLAYDLRQVLAKQLGDLKERINEVRLEREYSKWLFLLDSLFIEVTKKLKPEEMEEFNLLMEEANNIINKNPEAYNGKGDAEGIVYLAIRKLDIWLNRKMEDYHMFGSKEDDEGL